MLQYNFPRNFLSSHEDVALNYFYFPHEISFY